MNRYLTRTSIGVAVVFPLLVGCGGSSDGGGNSGAYTLEGTWEVSGTRYGEGETHGMISLTSKHLSIQTTGGGVTASLQDDGTFTATVSHDYGSEPLMAERTQQGAFNLGPVPLDLSGSWKVTDSPAVEGNGCTATLADGSFVATCLDSHRFWWMPDFSNGSLNCQRTSAIASRFGDFGGQWSCAMSEGGICEFRFDGSTITSSCTNARRMNGTMTITFNGDLASGLTSSGLEFSAKRN